MIPSFISPPLLQKRADALSSEFREYQQGVADVLAWERLQVEVSAELDRLAELGHPYQKRRDTITAVAWSVVTPGMSVDDALREPGTVSRGVYYNKEKDWSHNRLFTDVLEKVTGLVRGYVEGRNGRLRAYRKEQLDEKLYGLSFAILEDVREMVAWPLEQKRIEETRREVRNGEEVHVHETIYIEPAGWNKNTAGLNLQRAAKVGYMALGVDEGDEGDEGAEDVGRAPGWREAVPEEKRGLLEKFFQGSVQAAGKVVSDVKENEL